MSVVITGLGPVSLAGVGSEATARTLAGSPPLSQAESVGKLDLAGHLKAAKTYLDRNSQLALLAASLALEDAGLVPTEEKVEVGISFGTALGNLQTTETFLAALREKGPKLASPLLFIHSYPNTSSSLIAIEWTLTGPALNFCTGSSAGVDAIIAAAESVEDGKAQVMLAGAAETDGKLLRACYPGLGFREGAGMLTLESPECAGKREALVYAQLAAWRRGNDARECVMEALGEAGLKPEGVDLVVLDGTNRPEGIAQERCLYLHEYMGRTLSAGAALGVIAAAMRIQGNEKVRNAVVLTGGVEPSGFRAEKT